MVTSEPDQADEVVRSESKTHQSVGNREPPKLSRNHQREQTETRRYYRHNYGPRGHCSIAYRVRNQPHVCRQRNQCQADHSHGPLQGRGLSIQLQQIQEELRQEQQQQRT